MEHHGKSLDDKDMPTTEVALTQTPSGSSEHDDSSDISSVSSHSDNDELRLTPHATRTSDYKQSNVDITLQRTQTNGTTYDPAYEVDFGEDDNRNPRNWPLWKRSLIIAAMSYGTSTVVLYSTSYTSAIPGLIQAFGITDQIGILGITTYLLGMAVGSIILAPLSEMYGRRPVYIVAIGMFVILVLPCALAPNMASILATRFFGAFAASALISNAPGSVNDIVSDEHRALAFSIWSIGPMNGPVIGPVIGGFVYQYLGWRWTNWMVMILSGAAWIIVGLVPETYAPTLLRREAAKKRKATGNSAWRSRYDDKQSFWPLLKVNLSRPFVMTFTEPILMFWDVYVALVYGSLYLCFYSYGYIFSSLRGWSDGLAGLSFCGIGVGSLIVIFAEPLIRRVIDGHKPEPSTGKPAPEAMIFPVCIASILMPVGQIWFAWTSTPNVHWIVPIIASIPFGMGTTTIFIYASSYLIHSYGIYAASALAGNAVFRSILGATLPLAGPAMYTKLGPHWAGTILAIIQFVFIPIPFVFYKFGGKIRMKSSLIRSMNEDAQKLERRKQRALAKIEKDAEKRADVEASVGEVALPEAAMDEVDVERGRDTTKTG